MNDVRGRQGTGSVLSLGAVGRQDCFLDGSDQAFRKTTKRHTNFSRFQSVTTVDATPGVANWPFGQTVLVTLKPQQLGDLMTNMYLKCTLPLLQDVVEFHTVYADQPGRGILQKAIFRVDTQEIETIYTDWNIIRDEVYLSVEQKNSLKYLINGGQDLGALPTSPIKSGPVDLYVPLNFFFANNEETFFPTCAITQQQIVLSLTFNPVSFFSNTHTVLDYPGSQYTCGMPKFDIVTEQIIVSPEERIHFQTDTKSIIIETAKLQPSLLIPRGQQIAKNYLVPNIPVESFHWFLRKSAFEQPTGDFLNRFNYSDTTSTVLANQAVAPIMSDAIFFIAGQAQLGFMEDGARSDPQSAYYFKYVQTNTSGLSSPTRNIYTYTFALNPLSGPFTGSTDFKTLVGDKTFINLSMLNTARDEYVLNMFYIGLVKLNFSGGFLTIST